MDQGESLLGKALARDPNDRDALQYLGELRAAGVLWKVKRHRAQRSDFASVAEPLEKALALSGDPLEIQLALARLWLAQAQWERATQQDAGPSLAHGQSLAGRLLKTRPRWGEALAIQGGLNLEEAERLPSRDRLLKSREAQQAFAGAFTLNRNLIAEWKPMADRARTLAEKMP
jgi:hypothetical protein